MKQETIIKSRKKKRKEEPVVVLVEDTPPKKQKVEPITENTTKTPTSVYRQRLAEKQKEEELYKNQRNPSADTEPVDESPKNSLNFTGLSENSLNLQWTPNRNLQKKNEQSTPKNSETDETLESITPQTEKHYTPFGSVDSSKPTSKVTISTVPILISYDVTPDGIDFNIQSSNRITIGTQGDHVTAYRTFLELLAAGIDSQDPLEAISGLKEIANCYLSDDEMKELNEIHKKISEDTDIMPREERKELTKDLRKLSMEEAKISKLKNSIKIANNVKVAEYIRDMAMQILHRTNNMENMTFAKITDSEFHVIQKLVNSELDKYKNHYVFCEDKNILYYVNNKEKEKINISNIDEFKKKYKILLGEKTQKTLDKKEFFSLITSNGGHKIDSKKTKDKNAGNDVKTSIQCLKSLDRLCFIGKQGDDEDISDFKENDYFIDGISYFLENSKTLQKSLKVPKHEDNIPAFIKDDIEENYKDYCKKIISDKNFVENMGCLLEKLYDYQYKIGRDSDILCSSSAVHFSIVSQAFKHLLPSFEKSLKKEIFDKFLEKFFKNQGWINFSDTNIEGIIRDSKSHLTDDFSKIKFVQQKNIAPEIQLLLQTEDNANEILRQTAKKQHCI